MKSFSSKSSFILGSILIFGLATTYAGNVIFLIGDGMGPQQVYAAQCYQGGLLSFEEPESFPFHGAVTTYSANNAVTDSAAAATAMATGVKVNNGVISMAVPGDGSELLTLLEYAKAGGKRTGLATTTYITHATPAAFGAHEQSRDRTTQIADDYFYQTRPNLLFGGGANGMSVGEAQSAEYVVATDTAGFLAATFTGSYLSAQFGVSYLPYEYDYLGTTYPYPHLSEMMIKALAELENHPGGFFLMVEGGMIDQACHANSIERAVHETLEFALTVNIARLWAEGREDTLVLVTADHETGGLTVTQNNGAGNYPTVSWSTTGHTAANVPIYAWGRNAEQIGGTMNNTDLFAICADTLDYDLIPPVISDVAATQITDSSAIIVWSTDEPADSLVEYWPAGGGPITQVYDASFVTEHAILLSGLSPDSDYAFQVSSADVGDNLATDPTLHPFRTLVLNHPPIAESQNVIVQEDSVSDITLKGSDPDNDDPLIFELTSLPEHGAVSGSPPSVTYTPAPNYYGPDAFTFVVRDALAISDPAVVTINVVPQPDPPAAPIVTASPGDQSVMLTWSVAIDPDGDLVVYDIYRRLAGESYESPIVTGLMETSYRDTGLENGIVYYYVVRSLDSTLRFADSAEVAVSPSATANDAYVVDNPEVTQGVLGGADFTATQLQDGLAQTITESMVRGGNAASLEVYYTLHTDATPQDITTLVLHFGLTWTARPEEDLLRTFLWNGAGWEEITTLIVEGTFEPGAPSAYVDADGYLRVAFTDSSPFKKEPADTLSVDLLYAQISTDPLPNRPPMAGNDTIFVPAQGEITVNVLVNDSDPDGDVLSVINASNPALGSVTINADNTVTYTAGDTTGTDTFTYTISDEDGLIATATVTVTVHSSEAIVQVADLAMALITAGKNIKGQATVTVVDQTGTPQSGATVYGDWTLTTAAGTSTTLQTSALGMTDASGVATILSSPVKASTGDVFTFTITDVPLNGYLYVPGPFTEGSIVVQP